MRNHWHLYKIITSGCSLCSKSEFELSSAKTIYIWTGKKGVKVGSGLGDSSTYICEHDKICRLTILDVRRFEKYPNLEEQSKAKKEMGYVSSPDED